MRNDHDLDYAAALDRDEDARLRFRARLGIAAPIFDTLTVARVRTESGCALHGVAAGEWCDAKHFAGPFVCISRRIALAEQLAGMGQAA